MAIYAAPYTTGNVTVPYDTYWQPYNPTTDDFSKLFEKYTNAINEQICKPSPIVTQLKEKRPKMEENVVHEAMRKRRAKQAEARIAYLDDHFAENEYEDGDAVGWRVSFHDTPDKTYHYVALKGGNAWFVTGDANRYTLDALIEKIVGLSMKGSVWFEDADDPL